MLWQILLETKLNFKIGKFSRKNGKCDTNGEMGKFGSL